MVRSLEFLVSNLQYSRLFARSTGGGNFTETNDQRNPEFSDYEK